MRISKFFLQVGGLLSIILLFLYGCKKYDDSTLLDNTEKNYAYFKASMSQDKNIQEMYSEMKQASWLMAYKTYNTNKLSGGNAGERTALPSLKQKFSLLLNDVKPIKTRQQLLAFQGKLGFGSDGATIVTKFINQKNSLLNFLNDNPEFKLLSATQQKELIVNAINQIKLDNKNTITPTQEMTESDCINEYSQALDDADTDFTIELAAVHVIVLLCVVGTEGIGIALCEEAWIAGMAAAEVHYGLQLASANTHFNECMAMVPQSRAM